MARRPAPGRGRDDGVFKTFPPPPACVPVNRHPRTLSKRNRNEKKNIEIASDRIRPARVYRRLLYISRAERACAPRLIIARSRPKRYRYGGIVCVCAHDVRACRAFNSAGPLCVTHGRTRARQFGDRVVLCVHVIELASACDARDRQGRALLIAAVRSSSSSTDEMTHDDPSFSHQSTAAATRTTIFHSTTVRETILDDEFGQKLSDFPSLKTRVVRRQIVPDRRSSF